MNNLAAAWRARAEADLEVEVLWEKLDRARARLADVNSEVARLEAELLMSPGGCSNCGTALDPGAGTVVGTDLVYCDACADGT